MDRRREHLTIAEQNHLGHFMFLPKRLGYDLAEVQGVTIINCGLPTSMFNIAYGSPLGSYAADTVQEIMGAYNHQPFAWWIPPTQRDPLFTETLLGAGFTVETVEHAMFCDIASVEDFKAKTALSIKHVAAGTLLDDFISVLEPYDPHAQAFYGKMSDGLLQSWEKLAVGYAAGSPVTIGILFICGDSAGIFSLITREDARGRGYGGDMMTYLMRTAKEAGCKSITLSASSDAGYRIYERLGFSPIGAFECFEHGGSPLGI